MDILFVHRSFPAQFGRIALELTRRYGWRCHFLVEQLEQLPRPSESLLKELDVRLVPHQSPRAGVPWWQMFGHALSRGQAVYEAVRARPDLAPDLVVGLGGITPTLFLRELLPCPLVDYAEYYFAPRHSDLSYRQDLPQVEFAPFAITCLNAAALLNLAESDAAYSPTHWQRLTFPERLRGKIAVHHEGIDADLYRPTPPPSLAGLGIPERARVVTYVTRGFESIRGFDLFLQMARLVARERADVHFLIRGGEGTPYGFDRFFTGGATFEQWVLDRYGDDLSCFHFLGVTEPEHLAGMLCHSDLHVYLSVPFTLSWSLLDALACGCLVLANDAPQIREVIEPGVHGLLEPLFDVERLAKAALRALDDPAAYQPLRRAARQLIEERYSLEVTVPALEGFFERVAAAGR